MPIVYACMSMSKSHTGALIVIEQSVPLDNYAKSGDIIDAIINTRLIENIFFKNSPLHDGAMVIEHGRISAAGCILPVSHDSDVPRSLGLRHRSALGIAQATDAVAVVVSEETGNISVAHRGKLYTRVSTTELENRLNAIAITMNRWQNSTWPCRKKTPYYACWCCAWCSWQCGAMRQCRVAGSTTVSEEPRRLCCIWWVSAIHPISRAVFHSNSDARQETISQKSSPLVDTIGLLVGF